MECAYYFDFGRLCPTNFLKKMVSPMDMRLSFLMEFHGFRRLYRWFFAIDLLSLSFA